MSLRKIRRKFYGAFRVEFDDGPWGSCFWIVQPSKWGNYHGKSGSLPK